MSDLGKALGRGTFACPREVLGSNDGQALRGKPCRVKWNGGNPWCLTHDVAAAYIDPTSSASGSEDG